MTTQSQYRELASYLLGRVLVVDNMEHAIAIARKYRYSLRMVTVDGELLSPGGSMTGGAFKTTATFWEGAGNGGAGSKCEGSQTGHAGHAEKH